MSADADHPPRVLHVTPTVSRHGGGVWQFVRDLTTAQHAAGQEVSIAGLRDDLTARDTADLPVRLVDFPRLGPRALSFSPALRRELPRLAGEVDVLHAHGGLRMWPNSEVRRAARRAVRPTVLSPHGMLYPWLLRRSRVRKRLLRLLYDDRNLRSFDLIHATCEQELGYIREYGLRQPVAVIPAGVNVPADPPVGARERVAEAWPALRGRRIVLYLGIMERKKGLLRLAEAWRRLGGRFGDWRLVIAGPDQDGHRGEVERALFEGPGGGSGGGSGGGGDGVGGGGGGGGGWALFTGGVYGSLKDDLLAAADLFVLPSDWENFGIVVGESLALGVPVVTTTNTPWQWLADERAGWWIEPTPAALEGALEEALVLSGEELRSMGARGRTAVRQRYNWQTTARDLSAVYQWLSGQAPRPECVAV